VLESSNSGSLVDFAAGTKDVFVTYPAEKSISDGYGLLPVANGGTGATTLGANGVLLGNGTSAISATAVGSTGQVLVGNTGGAPSWATLSGIGVTSFSAGTTGLTPSSATTGAITLAGTLAVANGGTGATSLTSGYLVKGNGTSAASASVVYDDGTNVGVGTATPGAKLDVTGNVRVRYSSAGNASLVTNNTSTASGSTSQIIATNDASRSLRIQYSSSGGIGGSQLTGGFSGETAQIFTDGNYPISIGTNTTARLNIDTSGNVGIGTATPNARLALAGATGSTNGITLAASGWAYFGRIGMNGTSGGEQYWTANYSFATSAVDSAGEFSTYIQNSAGQGIVAFGTSSAVNTAPTERMRINAAGNVGIGTASPTFPLCVSANSGTDQAFMSGIVGGAYFGAVGAKPIVFQNNDTEKMRIDSSGNVGIGTASPGNKLAVAGGQINTVADEAYGIALNATTGNVRVIPYAAAYTGSVLVSYSAGYAGYGPFTIDAANIRFWTNGNERARIDGSGNLFVGATSGNGRLTVRGAGTTGSTYSFEAATSGGATRFIVADNGQSDFYNSSNGLSARFSSDGRFFIGATTGVGNDQMLVAFNSSGSITQAINMRDNNASGNGNSFIVLRRSDDTYLGAIGRSGTDSAMFVEGNSYLTLRTGGTERMRIDSSGNVVIGNTAAPYVTSGRTVFGVNGTSSTIMALQTAGSNRGYLYADGSLVALETEAGVSLRLCTITSQPVTFFTNNTERGRFDASGNFNLGTTAGLARLRVSAAASINAPVLGDVTNYPAFFSNADPLYGLGIGTNGGDGHVWLQAQRSDSATAYNLTLQEAGGNVGIGTASPAERLSVAGNLRVGTSSETNTYNINIVARSPAGGTVDWDFKTNDATYGARTPMTVTAAGNIGIGTTAPTDKLEVNGGAASTYLKVVGQSSTAYFGQDTVGLAVYQAANKPIYFVTNNAERARIDSSGNLLVGTTTAPVSGVSGVQLAPLFVRIGASSTANTGLLSFNNPNGEVGLVTVSGTATAYNTSSDYRLKEIDGPVANSGAYIDALKPVQGSWKADGSRFIGLLAHEVQEVSETPIATGEKDGEKMQAMDYSAPELIANLIAEIQSLRARVAQLEGN
jgi:hypothetical protein